MDGSSRTILVKEIEVLRAKALDKAMEEFPDQSVRPALVRRNTDKLSFSFLLAKPGPHTGNEAVYFSDQLLVLLAVLSILSALV